VTRRTFLVLGSTGFALLVVPFPAPAQQATRLWRVGFLGAASASGWTSRIEALRAGLRELGYVEGKNLVMEFRWADGQYDRLAALAADLVRLKVDILLTHGTPGSRAAKQATTTVPIVMVLVGDPVATGLVTSLARPGGNITGTTFFAHELAAKRIELLKEALPHIRRVAVLANAGNPASGLRPSDRKELGRVLGVEPEPFEVRDPTEIAGAFAAMARRGSDAVSVSEDGMLNANIGRVAELARTHRLPSTGPLLLAAAGGTLGYGINNPALYRRAAYFVDRILRGTAPMDLPIERPTTFELAINLKAATALGLAIPPAILLRADRVIE
jgi:putative ABC transport system substrate-binding protein